MKQIKAKNIGVFFGSRTTEHDISIITAQLIIAGLKGLNFDVTPIYINQDGYWMIDESFGRLESFTASQEEIKKTKYRRFYLDLQKSNGKMVFKKKGLFRQSISIDLAFPAFHGPFGEDGTIQGLFEMLNVPYTGCGVIASAISMDKALTKEIYQLHGFPTTKFIYFYKQDWEENKQAIINRVKENLTWPVFVKPAHLGSSIGISKIKENNIKNLEEKIEVALYYDDKVLVENGVNNLADITCCVIGNKKLQASLLQESVFQADLFDFEEKYLKEGGSQLGKSESGVIIPARVDAEITNQIQQTAQKVFRFLECRGIARVDFLFDKKTKEFFVNEVNSLPGTLYHHLWEKSGLSLNELLLKLISLAEENNQEKHNIQHTFQSSVLNSLTSNKLNIKTSIAVEEKK